MTKNMKRLVAAWLVLLGVSAAGFGDLLYTCADGYAVGTPPSTASYSVQGSTTQTIYAGVTATGGSMRVIFKFDISSYTTAVDSATLGFNLAGDQLKRAADLYSILVNDSSIPNGASIYGVDYGYNGNTPVLVGQAWGANATLGRYNLDVTSAVNAAITAGKDYVAFRIQATDESSTGANAYYFIRSSVYTTENERPTLTVVPEPATLGVLLVGGLFGIVRRKR